MADKVLARAFELAQAGVKAESDGRNAEAREMLAASIEAFKAVLAMPGFLKDQKTRELVQSEIANLQARREAILTRAKTVQGMEQRYNKLSNPSDEGALRDRLDQLTGMDKPAPTPEEIATRLKALKGESAENPKPATSSGGIFDSDEWKRGLDPELISVIEQARDETFM